MNASPSKFNLFNFLFLTTEQNLVPCRNCGRKFESSNLERHEPICSKVTSKRKKVFNSYKQRAAGTDLSSVRAPSVGKKLSPPVTHWREQHEDFINSIRSARLATDAVKKGLPLPPPPPPSFNPDYIECPYCFRRFNDTAAERHINFCKTNVNRKVVAKQIPQSSSSYQPRAPPPMAQVQMATKQITSPARSPVVPSTSHQPPSVPSIQAAPPVHSPPPVRAAPPVHSPPPVRAAPPVRSPPPVRAAPPVRSPPPVRAAPPVHSPSSTLGSPSRGKLTTAAQAVMGIRPEYDAPSSSLTSSGAMRSGARGPPPSMQQSRYM
ncbi:zinc finger C2HC domain-containing protein 1B-like [Heptranchias perlo]|uniref:zinc finger C2HC domain-containing protein 1B-like n=1 Tax=Heptranchias perlo TaxID=212740 RepID=UPI003559FCA9